MLRDSSLHDSDGDSNLTNPLRTSAARRSADECRSHVQDSIQHARSEAPRDGPRKTDREVPRACFNVRAIGRGERPEVPPELIDCYANALLRWRKRRRDALDASEKIIHQSLQCILAPQCAQKIEAQYVRRSLPDRQHLTIA